MRALVTGATGFIGARLAERLAQSGHQVLGFGAENTPLETARHNRLCERGVHVKVGRLADRALLGSLVGSVDVVFHLAAAQHETNVGPDYFRAVNVEGTRALLEASAAAGVRRFVYGSTIGVYGSAGDGRLDERSPTHPDNIYGITKLEAEEVVRRYEGRLPWTIIRISETYGPGDARLVKLFKLVDSGIVPMIGGGKNAHHPVFVDDLVAGLELAAERPEAIGETVVLAGKDVVQTRELIALVADALDKPLRCMRLPLTPLLLAALLCEKGCRPLGVPPPLTRRRLDFFVKRFEFSLEKAAQLLGYRPQVSFAEGVRQTAEWYRTNGYL